MKKTIFMMLLFFALFLSACSNSEKLANELIEYFNQDWSDVNSAKREKLESFNQRIIDIENNSVEYDGDMKGFYEEEVLPWIEDIINRLESLQLKHREVKKLNNIQIEAEEYLIVSFEKTIDHYNGDINYTELMNTYYELGKKYEAFYDYLDKLMDKYDLEFVEASKKYGDYKIKRKTSNDK